MQINFIEAHKKAHLFKLNLLYYYTNVSLFRFPGYEQLKICNPDSQRALFEYQRYMQI